MVLLEMCWGNTTLSTSETLLQKQNLSARVCFYMFFKFLHTCVQNITILRIKFLTKMSAKHDKTLIGNNVAAAVAFYWLVRLVGLLLALSQLSILVEC